MPYQKILCPLDLTPRSHLALKRAVELARLFGASLTLLNVHQEFLDHHEMIMLRVSEKHFEELQKQRAVASREKMREMLAELKAEDLPTEILIRAGKPHRRIVEIAEELGVDLIVMATNGRSSLEEWVLGSTTEQVIRHATCSVLAVRAPEEEL